MRTVPLPLLITLALSNTPTFAGTVLFSDLGTGGSVYNPAGGWAVFGSNNSVFPGVAAGVANLFTVGGSGGEEVTQIDLAVSSVSGLNTFTVSIWTDSGGVPGIEIADASWSLSTSIIFGTCCSLVSVTGISGVVLDGGSQYFMVVEPVSFTDTSFNAWNLNSQGFMGTVASTTGNGQWLDTGIPSTLAAFDIIGTPEPGSFVLCAIGVTAILGIRRRRSRSARP